MKNRVLLILAVLGIVLISGYMLTKILEEPEELTVILVNKLKEVETCTEPGITLTEKHIFEIWETDKGEIYAIRVGKHLSYSPNIAGCGESREERHYFLNLTPGIEIKGELEDLSELCTWPEKEKPPFSFPVLLPQCEIFLPGWDRDRCYLRKALKTSDVGICEKIDKLSTRDECYFEVAEQTGNKEFCFLLSNRTFYTFERCMHNLQV